MPNWKTIIDNFFLMSDPEGEFDHYAGAGASDETIRELETAIGVALPEEFHDFYKHCDGVGLASHDETRIPLFLRPIGEIHDYIAECRANISETHPNDATRYFPFIDWWNGNSSGYLLNDAGELNPEVYTFSHELYAYKAEQDLNDFIQPHARGIADLLSPQS